jgi:RecA/RadA recombinase
MAGTMVNIIGGNSSGKTLGALTMFAQLSHDHNYDDVKLIYDPVERGNAFDIRAMFGSRTVERVTIQPSGTAQQFHKNIRQAMNEGPVAYVLDSMDGLTTNEELAFIDKKLEEDPEAVDEKGNKKKGKGSYGMEKAKFNSQFFRTMMEQIESSGSLVVIISQTRDETNPTSYSVNTRSGGQALDFYPHHIVWLNTTGELCLERRGQKTQVGTGTHWRFTKNRACGRLRRIDIPVYYEIGMDDTQASVAWLIKYKFPIPADWDVSVNGGMLALCRQIENKGLVPHLHSYLAECWRTFEEECQLNRRNRWADEPSAN